MAADEELMDESLKEELAKYDEIGYFTRLGNMFKGLSKPHSSREYKEAKIELQRLAAPLLAFLIPVIGIGILIVVSSVGGSTKEAIKVEIVQVDSQEEELEEPETPEEVEPPPEMEVEVQMDSPVNNVEIATDTPAPTSEPQSPKVNSVDAMMNIKSPVMMKSVMGSDRSTGVRGQYTRGGKAYGDAQTEAAVMKALRWLKATQSADGSWGANKALGLNRQMDKAAGAGFAILTFLAHGETPASPEFGKTVEKALNYLINSVYTDKNGVVKMRGASGSEYGYLIATYALCEAYGMTKNPNARKAAQQTLGRIIAGQTATGGWNYNMARVTTGAPDDISYGGWAMQALKAAKMAGIRLPGMEECIKKSIRCLKTRNYNKKAGFVYRPGSSGGGLGGVGCLCMQLLGYAKDPEVVNALDVMKNWAPTFDKKHMSGGQNSQYYSYYAAQCKYQAGMCKDATPANQTAWVKWNAEMKKVYPKAIITVMDPKTKAPYTIKDAGGKDRQIGRWENGDHYAYDVMSTCLVALQLMVYYRYLPTTSLKATEVEVDVEALSKDKSGEIGVSIDI
jgi:hypothetical protein